MMGGAISMESELGQGHDDDPDTDAAGRRAPARQRRRQPRALPAATAMRRTAPGIAQAETEGTLVLLVDDHPVNRCCSCARCERWAMPPRLPKTASQALEMWKSGRFGLVITDCHMPQHERLRTGAQHPQAETDAGRERVPIIACTANALQGEAEACLAAGMDDFLVKPVELAQLIEKLDRWLPLPQAPSPPAAPPAQARRPPPPSARSTRRSSRRIAAATRRWWAEVLAAFRRTCEDDSAGLKQAVAADDVAQVTLFAHRMAGASKMVGALAFAAACETIERASRVGDWKAVLAGMSAFEQERMRLAAYFEGRKETA